MTDRARALPLAVAPVLAALILLQCAATAAPPSWFPYPACEAEPRFAVAATQGCWREVADSIRSECGSLAGARPDLPGAADLCELGVRVLVNPQGGLGPDDLPADVAQGLGMTGDELAGFVLLVRAQLEKMRVQVDLPGAVSDVEGFALRSGGGWTVGGNLYELVDRTLAWTVLAETAPSGAGTAGPGRESAPAAGSVATPEVRALVDVSGAGGSEVAYVLRAALPAGGEVLGVVVACLPNGGLQAAAAFGGYPPDGRPVQLAVRTADGRVERFGPLQRGAPGSGVHAPRVVDPAGAWRFAAAALGEGLLVSNGFRSLWNRAGPADNGAARTRLRDCMQK